MSLRGLVVLGTLLSISLSVFAKDAKDYWEDTELEYKSLNKIVNNNACYVGETEYVACVYAIQSLSSELNSTVFITSDYFNKHKNDVLKVLKKNQWVAIVKLKQPNTVGQTKLDIWKFLKNQREEILASFKEYFKVGRKLDFDLLQKYYQLLVTAKKPNKYIIAKAMNSYFSVVYDPHSYMIPKGQFEARVGNSSEQFVGVGIYYEFVGGQLIVQKVFKNGPADKAGLKNMDVVTQIGDKSLSGLEKSDVSELIRGTAGSTVKFKVLRRKQTELELTITRASVDIVNVTADVINTSKLKIGYIKLDNFTDNQGCASIEKSLKDFNSKNVQALVLDLRANGGGQIAQAVCIAGLFIGKGKVVVKEKDLDDGTIKVEITKNDQVTNLPLVTLVDGNSASASELLAGALQDYKRSWIIGEKTFGKGTVQSGYQMTFDEDGTPFGGIPFLANNTGIYFFKTIERFYSPTGYTNQLVGIIPDFEIPIIKDASEEERFFLREADLYTNAIKTENEPRQTLRPDEVKKLKSCADTDLNGKLGIVDDDYQLSYAAEVLTCQAQ